MFGSPHKNHSCRWISSHKGIGDPKRSYCSDGLQPIEGLREMVGLQCCKYLQMLFQKEKSYGHLTRYHSFQDISRFCHGSTHRGLGFFHAITKNLHSSEQTGKPSVRLHIGFPTFRRNMEVQSGFNVTPYLMVKSIKSMDTWNIFPSNNIMEMWKWVEIMETYGISHQKPWEFVWKYGTSFHSLAKHRFPQKKLPIGGCTTPFSETPNYHISGIISN